jgi:stage II sporulation protein D
LILSACAPPRTPAPPPVALPQQVLVRAAGRVAPLPLEQYVLGTVLAEVAPTGEPAPVVARILEVQAIVARSYAAARMGRHRAEGFDFCDTTHCQVYDPARIRTSRFATAARDAVDRTAGQVLTYGPHAVEALFHADCGGATSAASDVWGGAPVPYLLPRLDDVASSAHRTWRWTVPAADLRAALGRDPRTDVGASLRDITVASRDAGGRAQQIRLEGARPRVVRGEDLRAAVARVFGARTLQSARLTVSRKGTSFVFEGTGYGHGVGLCQTGAAARARRGESLEQILDAYFTGARLVETKSPR